MRVAAALCVVCGCAAPSSPPCTARMELLVGMERARVHGLTENDDVREAIQRVSDAAACASPQQMPVIITHARLLAQRLAARGATAELLTLARSLQALPLGEQLRHDVAAATAGPERRLTEHAQLLTQQEPSLRSALVASAVSPTTMPPATTGVFLAFVTEQESCAVVVPGADAPDGTVVFSIRRRGVELPLHGDSPAVSWAASRRTAVRLCVQDALREGDTLTGQTGGAAAVNVVLSVSNDDVARGAAMDALRGLGGVPRECHSATQRDSRLACAWAQRVTP